MPAEPTRSLSAARRNNPLGDDSVSLDDLVTRHEGRAPQALIEEEGEAHFRDAETRALRRELETGSARVIDTGGGAWTLPRNRALAAEHHCLTVWLDAPFALCWERITAESGAVGRPLAPSRERAAALYDARRAAYALAALHLPVTPARPPEELAAHIAAAARA